MTTPYERGRNREDRIKRKMLAKGYNIVVRSAGSKSPIDLIGIDVDSKVITLIQSKVNMKKSEKIRLEKAYNFLQGNYSVIFEAVGNDY